MKAGNLFYNRWLTTGFMFFLVLSLIFSVSIFRSNGLANGPGTPITPYEKGKQLKEKDIQAMKAKCSSSRVISDLRVKGSRATRYGEQIGFAYVTKKGAMGEPSFNLKGIAESGEEISVDLSGVQSLTVIKVEDRWFTTDRALLELTIFPDISPSEILSLNPTYSQLETSYTKTIKIRVALEDRNKGKLSIVGKKWLGEDKYEVISGIRDLELDSRVLFGYPMHPGSPIWWAVESVIKDERYPYRIRFGR